MATKAEIKAAIQAQLTLNAGLTTHTQHEEFLHTEADSILENVYSEIISETHLVNSITTPNSQFEYDVKIAKIGRVVHIYGSFENVSTVSLF